MMSLPPLLSEPSWQHLVAALLHTLWQAPLVAAVLYGILRAMPANRVRSRYTLASGGLSAVVMSCLLTWSILDWRAERAAVVASDASAGSVAVTRVEDSPVLAAPAPVSSVRAVQRHARPSGNPAWATAAAWGWLVGAGLMLVRVVVRLGGSYRLQRRARPLEKGAASRIVDDLRARLGIRRPIRVLVVDGLGSPAVAGLLWPVVLVPASLLTDLPPQALMPILAHELAHVRRYDVLVNLVQMLIEAVLFFNPAVWWISRQVRFEREACCDALAANLTGEPARYAHSLVAWAERLLEMPGLSPAGVTAFADGGGRPLLDRARRLLVPGYRPELKVSWAALLAAVLVGGGLFIGLLQGTRTAVALAAEVLSAEQRMEQLVEGQGEYAPLSTQPVRAESTVVEGVIRTEDGEALTGPVRFISHSESPGHTTQKSHRSNGAEYSLQLQAGSVLIQADAEGYAPVNLGPIRAKPGETVEGFDILLKRGVQARLQLLDESDRPVDDAIVEGGMSLSGGHSWRPLPGPNETGIVALNHLGAGTYVIRITADGYEPSERRLEFAPDQTVRWVLARAKLTKGIILDVDGKPVADASLRLFARVVNGETKDLRAWDGDVLAVTDDQGRFTLDRLRSDCEYVLLVETPDAHRQIVHGVRAGREGFEIRLEPAIVVRGKVIGDLGKLTVRDGRSLASYSQTVSIGNHSHGSMASPLPLEVRGGEATFEIADLLPGRLDFTVAASQISVPVERSRDDVVIDLDKLAAKRVVLLKFEMPGGLPSPTGALFLTAVMKDWRRFPPSYGEAEIVDGQAEFDAFVGGSLTYRPQQLVGAYMDEGKVEYVPPGEEPFVVSIKARPAGAIVGRVDAVPLSSAASMSVSVHVAPGTEPPVEKWSTLHNVEVEPGTNTFMATPLPLGGTYVVKASRGKTMAISEPVRVDAATPMPRVDLKLPPGLDIEVVVLDPEGRPAQGVPVAFSYESVETGSGSYSPDSLTDERGRIRFEGLNPDSRFKYFVRLPLQRDYQPTDRLAATPGGGPVTIRLERGLVLKGRVVEAASGKPLKDCDVRAYPAQRSAAAWIWEGYRAESRTNEQGEFRFSNLPPGRYRLIASPNFEGSFSYSQPDHATEFAAGATEPAEVRISVKDLSERLRADE